MVTELKFLRTLELLTGEGSQKKKSSMLKDGLNPKLEYILDICFNPFVTTKLHKVIIAESSTDYSGDIWSDFKQLLEELKKAPAATLLLRERAEKLLSSKLTDNLGEDLELRKTLMKILTKRMNIGIGAKIINKAIGRELIPDPSLMLATDDHDTLNSWNEIFCEEKYDGVRVIALYKNGEISYFTRAFNELDSSCFPKISFDLKTCMINSGLKGDWFFDGELTDLNRKSVSGKVTQILKGTVDEKIESGIIFNVFDLEEAETLNNKIGLIKYLDRRQNLESVCKYLPEGSPVQIARMWQLDDPSQITPIYKNIVNIGGEGVICKNNSPYECKRSKSWVKFKEVSECDLVITGWFPGEGKREGFIGGLICSDLSGTLQVRIGAGFTDEDLRILSKDPDSLISKIASVEYNVPITDKNGNRSLFLPRFVVVRDDKTISDDLSSLF